MNSSLILVAVLLSFCCSNFIQAGVLGKEEVSKEKLTAEEAVLNITKECDFDKVVIESTTFIDPGATAKFIRGLKCGISCKLKSIGLITDSHEFVKEAIGNFKLYVAAQKYFVSNCTDDEFYDKCSHVKDLDDCEYANKLMHCIYTNCIELVV